MSKREASAWVCVAVLAIVGVARNFFFQHSMEDFHDRLHWEAEVRMLEQRALEEEVLELQETVEEELEDST